MIKNGGGKIALFAFDTANNVPKTGDAANLTAYVSKDGGAADVLTDTSATELDSTNAKGVYLFDVSAGESNADLLVLTGKSSTTGIQIDPVFHYPVVDSSGVTALLASIATILERVDVATSTRSSHTPFDVWHHPLYSPDFAFNGNGAGSHLLIVKGFAENIDFEVGTIQAKTDLIPATPSSHTAEDVWAVSTRTLSSFGTLVADTAAAVWASVTRTLSAFGFTVATSPNATETAIKAKTDNLPASPAATGDAMTLTAGERTSIGTAVWASATRTLSSFGTLIADIWASVSRTLTDKIGFSLTSGERTAIANEVEAQIIDDADAEKVLTAITDKIASVNPDLAGITVAAIADAVWDESAGDHVAAESTGAILAKLDIGEPTDPVIPVIAAPASGQVVGALFTYDGQGALLPSTSITFQLLRLAASIPGSHRTAPFAVISAGAAAANPAFLAVALQAGGDYRARRGAVTSDDDDDSDAPWVYFNAPTGVTSFALPPILGSA